MKNILFTDVSVKRQITDSISENFTDSDLESTDTSFHFYPNDNEMDKIKLIILFRVKSKILELDSSERKCFLHTFTAFLTAELS